MDCELPCWWGIEPGLTQFSDVVDKFSPYAARIALKEFDNGSISDAELLFPISENKPPVCLATAQAGPLEDAPPWIAPNPKQQNSDSSI